MRLEFIPIILILSLLVVQVVQYFLAKRRAVVTANPATTATEECQTTTPQRRKLGATEKIEKFMENEEKFWLLGFIVVAIITILLYTALNETGSDRWRIVGLITLVGMHVFIFWNFFRALLHKEKLHPATKQFVAACLIFWSVALFTPNFAEWAVTESKGVVTAFDKRFDPKATATRKSEDKSARRTRRTLRTVLKTTTQTLHLEPGRNNFRKVEIPSGTRIIESVEWSCQDGCIIEVEHDMSRLCEIGGYTENDGGLLWALGTYLKAKCRVTTIPSSPGVIRYREQFLAPSGADNNNFFFPRNLIHVIVSFGTNNVMGPKDVIATAVTSS
jgi:hypothetical protein